MIDLTARKPVVSNPDYAVRIPGLIDDLQVAASAPVPPFGHKPSTTSGLTWGYYGGQRWINGVLTTVADSTLALTASVTNYVEYTDAGVVSKNSTGFSADKNPIAEITTDGSSITGFVDRRSQRDPATCKLSKSVAGGTDVPLTAAESRCEIFEFTGLLTASISVIVPARTRPWIVFNNTTGAFGLTVKTAAGTGVAVGQAKHTIVYGDGTNVVLAFDDLGVTVAPFIDSTAIVKNAADATKLVKLSAANITTGTTRTLTAPDRSATIATVNALGFVAMTNGTIAHSRSGGAETISIKTLAGNDPSAGDPVAFVFRNAGGGTGDYTYIEATAALSITISSGSTLGMVNSVASRLALVVFNDSSTLRLGIVNVVDAGTFAASSLRMQLRDDVLQSSTAEGGAGAADNPRTIYTGTAVATKAMRIIGYLDYTLAAVGTWNAAPTKVQLIGLGQPHIGDPLVEEYTSGGQTITAAGPLTLAHGLARTPALVQTRLRCGTAEAGYSIGDELIAVGHSLSSSQGVAINVDSTNINVRYGNNANVFSVPHKTTGTITNLTNGNWTMVIKAWG